MSERFVGNKPRYGVVGYYIIDTRFDGCCLCQVKHFIRQLVDELRQSFHYIGDMRGVCTFAGVHHSAVLSDDHEIAVYPAVALRKLTVFGHKQL